MQFLGQRGDALFVEPPVGKRQHAGAHFDDYGFGRRGDFLTQQIGHSLSFLSPRMGGLAACKSPAALRRRLNESVALAVSCLIGASRLIALTAALRYL